MERPSHKRQRVAQSTERNADLHPLALAIHQLCLDEHQAVRTGTFSSPTITHHQTHPYIATGGVTSAKVYIHPLPHRPIDHTRQGHCSSQDGTTRARGVNLIRGCMATGRWTVRWRDVLQRTWRALPAPRCITRTSSLHRHRQRHLNDEPPGGPGVYADGNRNR